MMLYWLQQMQWGYTQAFHIKMVLLLLRKLLARHSKKISTNNLIRMAEFMLSSNFFEFNSDTFQQISGMAVGTKFESTYDCTFIDQVEKKFQLHNLISFQDGLGTKTVYFLDRLMGKNNQKNVYQILIISLPILSLSMTSKKDISFLDLKVSLTKAKLSTDFHIKPH